MQGKFRSIGSKLSLNLAVSTIIPLLLFCIFFYTNMRTSYRENYIQQSDSSMSISIQNINHYVSTCITSAKSVYFNSDLQLLLLSGDPGDFNTIESPQSNQVLSYLLSVYAATPDAVQIRLAAYQLDKSFLLTTSNLQRYIRTEDYSQVDFTPWDKPFQAEIEPVHVMHSYGHIITYSTQQFMSDSQYVFTIHLPIYILPRTDKVVGMLSIDFPISFIENSSKYTSREGEVNYVVDQAGNVIFSSEPDRIGHSITPAGILDIFGDRSSDDTALVTRTNSSFFVLSKGFGPEYLDWYMVKTVPSSVVYEDVRFQLWGLLISFCICLVVAVLSNSISALRYTTPLKRATAYMGIVDDDKEGDLDAKLSDYVVYDKNDEIGVLLRALESMLDSINDFTIRQYKLDIANKTTELKMLQAQINPHFIYNTLQCLATRAIKNNDREQYNYISSLGQMMQYSMEMSRPLVPLRDEALHVARYIQLQKMRFTGHLQVIWEISPDTQKIMVPKMIIQPLIENSFKHGTLLLVDRGILTVRSYLKGELLYVEVVDNGVPVTGEQRASLQHQFHTLRGKYNANISYHGFQSDILEKGSGAEGEGGMEREQAQMYSSNEIGLSNVFLRLLLNFGSSCDMDIFANDVGGTTVRLCIAHQTPWPPQGIQEEGDDSGK